MPTVIAQYRYDPLDRLSNATALRRFYCAKRIATEIEGDTTWHFFGHSTQPLALRESPLANSVLLATDQQASVLHNVTAQGYRPQAYSPFGYHPAQHGSMSALGFNGERPEPVTGHYLLGQGYRAYNPVLMRFNSPDSWSPFGKGGINSYAYCEGEPINQSDPNGHSKWALVRQIFGKGRVMTRAGIGRSRSLPNLIEPISDSDPYLSKIGWHGSTKANGNSLKSGLKASHMDTSAGLSSGRGFYVAPTKGLAKDFADVAADVANDAAVLAGTGKRAEPAVFAVYMKHFDSKIPGRDYRFATMGEGGLKPRHLSEMEILIKEHQYSNIAIRDTRVDSRQVLPRASEAPF